MFLELESVFNVTGLTEPFRFNLPASYNALPFAQQPVISGEAKNRAGVVTLEGTAHVKLASQCDRCAQNFDYDATVPLEHTLVLSLNNENTDGFVLLDGYRFNPCDLIWEDIVLAMPQKFLCRTDCAGLCHHCGANRNDSPCACKPEVNPRLAALAHLLEDSSSNI